jgi:hypothetical protein
MINFDNILFLNNQPVYLTSLHVYDPMDGNKTNLF